MVKKIRIAVASSDGLVVNQHFGRCDLFWIYDVDEQRHVSFIETRAVQPACVAGNHENKKLETNIKKLQDCKYILVSRIGQGANNILQSFHISAFEIPGIIEESIHKALNYIEIQDLLIEKSL